MYREEFKRNAGAVFSGDGVDWSDTLPTLHVETTMSLSDLSVLAKREKIKYELTFLVFRSVSH